MGKPSVKDLEARLRAVCGTAASNGVSWAKEPCDGYVPLGSSLLSAGVSFSLSLPLLVGTFVGLAVGSSLLSSVAPTRGKELKYHGIFLGCMSLLLFTPSMYYNLMTGPTALALAGGVFPSVQSIHAVLSEGTDDDTHWLNYWV